MSLSVRTAGPIVPKAVQRAVTAIFGPQNPPIEHEKHENEGGTDKFEAGARTRLERVLDAQGSVEEIEIKIPVGLVHRRCSTRQRTRYTDKIAAIR